MSHREKGYLLPFLLIRPLSSEKEACEQKELELLESLYLRWSQHKNVPKISMLLQERAREELVRIVHKQKRALSDETIWMLKERLRNSQC